MTSIINYGLTSMEDVVELWASAFTCDTPTYASQQFQIFIKKNSTRIAHVLICDTPSYASQLLRISKSAWNHCNTQTCAHIRYMNEFTGADSNTMQKPHQSRCLKYEFTKLQVCYTGAFIISSHAKTLHLHPTTT